MEKETVNSRIAALIEALDLSVRKFSKKTGISSTGVHNIVNNHVTPRLETLGTILKTFPNVNRDWLISGEGEMFALIEQSNPQSSSFATTLLQKLEAEISKKDKEIERLWDLVSKLAPVGKLKASTMSLNSMQLKTAA
jgi:transcriptional regulator with XRE-family HTH domain